jgi:gamma-glutamylcyclotransferase (GGCT)/AIG2-like uncharacterized protein YtfP
VSVASAFLFVYGTLMRGFPLHHLVADGCEFVGAGTVKGRLLNLGRYPGALPEESGWIHGEVYRLLAPGLLASLDREEGYRPEAPARSLYLRRSTPVFLADDRELTAWIYWYRGSRRGAVPIPDGDYRQHINDRAATSHHPNGGAS